jgi:hypothetical protein
MWRTRLEVKALLERSEHIRQKAAEIQRQLQTLMLYWERLLQRQRARTPVPNGLLAHETSYNEA